MQPAAAMPLVFPELREEGLERPELFIDKPIEPEDFIAEVAKLIGR